VKDKKKLSTKLIERRQKEQERRRETAHGCRRSFGYRGGGGGGGGGGEATNNGTQSSYTATHTTGLQSLLIFVIFVYAGRWHELRMGVQAS